LDIARENDLVLLISRDEKRFILRLAPGEAFHTHHGRVFHDDILNQPLGRIVRSHLGHPFTVLQPSVHDLIINISRATQIMYPKEIGYLLLKLGIGPGARVVEAGTGSGGLTMALAYYVRPAGRVFSYEVRTDMQRRAAKSLAQVGLLDIVELKERDISIGFDEHDADACFLDVREPWLYLQQAWDSLKGGGFFGSLVPTTNQVSDLLANLQRQPFTDVEVCEIILRNYKPVSARLRPMDRMTAHTGYLVFARKVIEPEITQEVSESGDTRELIDDGNDSLDSEVKPASTEAYLFVS
jgi:tRNA (adenine57-N1/adenine58-N1)-methyltransferase catalytic subunit